MGGVTYAVEVCSPTRLKIAPLPASGGTPPKGEQSRLAARRHWRTLCLTSEGGAEVWRGGGDWTVCRSHGSTPLPALRGALPPEGEQRPAPLPRGAPVLPPQAQTPPVTPTVALSPSTTPKGGETRPRLTTGDWRLGLEAPLPPQRGNYQVRRSATCHWLLAFDRPLQWSVHARPR